MRTITANTEIDRLFAGGRRVSNPALLVLVAPTPPEQENSGRVVFVAGRRLGNAVVRNRCKRVLRETTRRCGGPWAGWDVAVVARRSTGAASPETLDAALASALRALGITQ